MSDNIFPNKVPIPNQLTKPDEKWENEVLSSLNIISDYLDKYAEEQRKRQKVKDIVDAALEKEKKRKQKEIEGSSQYKFAEFLKGLGNKITEKLQPFAEGFQKTVDFGFKTFLGPLQLLTSPLEELLGKDLLSILNPFSTDKKYKGALTKNKIKEIDPGIVWYWNQLEEKKNKEKEGSALDKFLKGFGIGGVGSLLKGLGIGAGVLMIVGGLIMAVVDGIQGWIKSGAWGVSKISGFIGGFFAGTKSGWAGAFSNMGKWALIGAGIGMIAAGPVGALVGGLIGAAVGAILGFIGGEYIAKNLDKVGMSLKTLWNDPKQGIFSKIFGTGEIIFQTLVDAVLDFTATIPTMIYAIFEKDPKKQKDFKNKIKDIGKIFYSLSPFTFIANLFGSFKEAFQKFSKSKGKNIFGRLAQLGFDLVTSGIRSVYKMFVQSFESLLKVGFGKDVKAGDFFKNLFSTIAQTIGNFFTKGVNLLKDNPFTRFIDDIVDNLGRFFKPLIQFFQYAGEVISKDGIFVGLGKIIADAVGGGKGFSEFQTYANAKEVIESGKSGKGTLRTQDAQDIISTIAQMEKQNDLSKEHSNELIKTLKEVQKEISKNKQNNVQVNNKNDTIVIDRKSVFKQP